METALPSSSSRRKILTTSIAAMCQEAGFGHAEEMALETLGEMLQSFITQVGISSHNYCELAGRVEPVIGDVILGLISMGVSVYKIEKYAQRPKKAVIPTPTQATVPKHTGILQTGQKRPHPSHIPDHLPAFPDSHAYIQTPTHKQPVTEYEAIREKAACQKRDVERALTRFVAKTGDTQSLFLMEDNAMFPRKLFQHAQSNIAVETLLQPLEKPYIHALYPKDQIFEEDESVTRMKKQELENEEEAAKFNREKGSGEMIILGETTVLDNPYLRSPKLPSMKKKKM